jgi:molybdopterin molybdotransferase
MLAAGSLLTPGALSLLATHGIAEVAVHRAPRVAVIVTGDEVVPPAQVPAPGQLRDSHSDFLAAAGAGLGLDFELLGVVGDDSGKLRERVRQGLAADVLLLTGGVSMGELDLVEGVLAELGCTALFDSVAWQPGKPLVAMTHPGSSHGGGPSRNALVFGLPGNPASVMVCFWLFVRPALRRLLGLPDAFWRGTLTAELAAPLPAATDRDRFLPADLSFEDGRWLATPRSPRGSHDLLAFAHGTALARVRAGEPARGAGEPCEVLVVGCG